MPLPEFIERRFPEKYSKGSEWSYGFSTEVVEANKADEYRNINWDTYRGVGRISHNIKSAADFDELRDFGINAYGQGIGFRFRNWEMYQTIRPSFLHRAVTGDGIVGNGTIQLKLTHRMNYRDTAQAATSTDITLAATQVDSIDHAVDDAYNGMMIRIISGLGAGQSRWITDYTGSTKVADVSPAWTADSGVTPDGSSIYEIEDRIFQKEILKPAPDVSHTVYVNNESNSIPGTLNYKSGVFTRTAGSWADQDIILADFGWDWPARLNKDLIKAKWTSVRRHDWQGIDIIEWLNPPTT